MVNFSLGTTKMSSVLYLSSYFYTFYVDNSHGRIILDETHLE